MADDDEHLAYGDLPGRRPDGDRGLIGGAFQSLKENEGFASIFNKIQSKVKQLGDDLDGRLASDRPGKEYSPTPGPSMHRHRYGSFAGPLDGNDVKWHVDGCAYMWAVSVAIEQARESIWILDWWLSPELYLRRPPSKNEKYRLDRMLQAAAQRGVKVNVIVYKEVAQALTLSIPKHALEALDPNISVFRHPDHLPDAQTLQSSFLSSIKHLALTAEAVAKLPEDAIKAVYGMNEDVILFWAHHEKLCLIDGQVAFMGGLDLCYGRWDTYQHSISDCHPGNLDEIVFPGQDYNNARVMDFQNVADWENNKLDRRDTSRMGWSDISISLSGPVVEDLKHHFLERWNFIYSEKYDVRGDTRYSRLSIKPVHHGPFSSNTNPTTPGLQQQNQGQAEVPYFPPPPVDSRGIDQASDQLRPGHPRIERIEERGEAIREKMADGFQSMKERYSYSNRPGDGSVSCQIVRSCTNWSNGTNTEDSIANAYISIIKSSQHFVYIENQFFITATSDKQAPVKNRIGAAIVERILRAARAGENYKLMVVMPAIPAFAGDLKDDSSLGTRAIMDYQYKSINRGGYSIMEEVANAGYEPTKYIRFYNLRNYDRINNSAAMERVEKDSGVDYETARREHDDIVDPVGYHAQQGGEHSKEESEHENYQKYQTAASSFSAKGGPDQKQWDSVAACYMHNGPDIRAVPWTDGETPEMDAFVSEELYIHSKVMIADDRVVICGSANLNDRSQLGYHDSEIAVVIEDSEEIRCDMGSLPWRATKFAATLRRQLCLKHLGLLSPQSMMSPDDNFQPIGVPNSYVFGSEEDDLVSDPLADRFLNYWNNCARRNTEAFRRVFHAVPDDNVKTWADYDNFHGRFFAETDKDGKKVPPKYKRGHVVAENFPPGPELGVKAVKEVLSGVKGTLVEMPLLFLIKEDIAKEGLTLNSLTEEVYT